MLNGSRRLIGTPTIRSAIASVRPPGTGISLIDLIDFSSPFAFPAHTAGSYEP